MGIPIRAYEGDHGHFVATNLANDICKNAKGCDNGERWFRGSRQRSEQDENQSNQDAGV